MSDLEQFSLAVAAKRGVTGVAFDKLRRRSPLTTGQWSQILGLSQQTLGRYRREGRRFDVAHSDKILQIELLVRRGSDVFGDQEIFFEWLQTPNAIFKGRKPLDLMDSSFGINLLLLELGRIEHGIFA